MGDVGEGAVRVTAQRSARWTGSRVPTAVAGAVTAMLLAAAAPAAAAPGTGCPAPEPPDSDASTTVTSTGATSTGATSTGGAPAPHGFLATMLDAVIGDLGGAAAPRPAAPCPPATPWAGDDTSAAVLHGWGEPVRADDFTGTALGDRWNVYDGPGHAGNGRRTPDAVGVRDGLLTITGNSRGDTAGMEWVGGQRYGRWEGRVKAPASDETYNALLLLWPDAENFPVGGEVDFMEMMDHTRQETNLFLHYGKDNRQVSGTVEVDATQWHNWAVEWTPTHVAAFLDGKEWWRTDRTDVLPPGPMHLCIQLDWFPGKRRGDVQQSTMQVDWVRQYALSPADIAKAAADDAARDAEAARRGVDDTHQADDPVGSTSGSATPKPPALPGS